MYELSISQKALKALRKAALEIASKIRERLNDLAENPFSTPNVKKLTKHPGYRLQVGDGRILYVVEERLLVVHVITIGHRKDVYR